MGCRESKIKRINLSPEAMPTTLAVPQRRAQQANRLSPRTPDAGDDDDLMLPNRLLSAIPVSDLGDSLDSRHLSESLNLSLNGHHRSNHNAKDGSGAESTDSGFDDYDEEYAHIITESSSPDKVRRVEEDFKPVDLPELLVITGRACARILSGYQRGKMEESRILDALREEGLLAKPKSRTSGGLSFEVVEAAREEEKDAYTESGGAAGGSGAGGGGSFDAAEVTGGDIASSLITSQFVPRKKLERMEMRRENLRKPSARLETRLAEAEERRRAVEEEKVKTVLERSGLDRHGRMRSASAMRRDTRYSATVAKRQLQLQEMRDKLKDKHKRNDMVRLRHNLMLESGGDYQSRSSSMESGFTHRAGGFHGDDDGAAAAAAGSGYFDDD